MNSKKEILERMDSAIDNMDMAAVDQCLNQLSAISSERIEPEEARLFSERIKKLNKGSLTMKSSHKTARIAIVAAAITLLGVTAYAASEHNLFAFLSGDSYVTMRAPGDMTEQEAKQFVKESESAVSSGKTPEASSDPENAPVTNGAKPTVFDSIDAAAKALDMKIVLPSTLSGMKLDRVSGQEFYYAEGYRSATIWLDYEGSEGDNLGVTITREVVADPSEHLSYTLHDIDKGSMKSYKSKTGIEYDMVTESNDGGGKTAQIANTMVGEYEYALVFYGFDEAEQYSIIDSVDLTPYQN